jgi:hypothetical protein
MSNLDLKLGKLRNNASSAQIVGRTPWSGPRGHPDPLVDLLVFCRRLISLVRAAPRVGHGLSSSTNRVGRRHRLPHPRTHGIHFGGAGGAACAPRFSYNVSLACPVDPTVLPGAAA